MFPFLVYSKVLLNGIQVHLTEDRVMASSKEDATRRIERKFPNQKVTSVIRAY